MFRDPRSDEMSRLLIVDDDHDFAASLAGLLALDGYEVLVAHDIATALTLAPQAAVALVDIRLGRDDGVKLAADMLERDPKLLVVMITAYASVQTAIKALRAEVLRLSLQTFRAGRSVGDSRPLFRPAATCARAR